ncbi:MAG TPA: DMT family transporter [Dongiaceae bacterium]|jgi:drug/metabolite transporter (DMT)-like permease|nr:DMT family transporter [Dongiaceae bacterium]
MPVQHLALLLLLGAALIDSSGGIFVRLSSLGPDGTAFFRMALALPVLGALLWAECRRKHLPLWPSFPARIWLAIFLAGIFIAADLVAWHRALRSIPVGAAVLLGNTAPLWVVVSGYLLFDERFGWRFVGGMGLALGGMLLLVVVGQEVSGGHLLGYGLALLGGMGYGFYLRGIAFARQSAGNGHVIFFATLVSALALLPVAILSEPHFWPQGVQGWAMVGGLALASQVVGMALIAWAMGYLPAALSAVSLLIGPVGAASIAWLVLDEAMSPLQIAAGMLVLLGILIAQRSDRAVEVPSTP